MKNQEPHVSTAWINVASFDNPDEAIGLSHVLRDEGIDARVQDERTLQKSWFLTRPSRAGVHVCVPEPSFAFAQNYMEISPLVERFVRRAAHCPSCHSARVQFPQMTRKNILPTVVAQVLVLLRVMKHEYYCEACHYTWQPGEASPAALASPLPRPKHRPSV